MIDYIYRYRYRYIYLYIYQTWRCPKSWGYPQLSSNVHRISQPNPANKPSLRPTLPRCRSTRARLPGCEWKQLAKCTTNQTVSQCIHIVFMHQLQLRRFPRILPSSFSHIPWTSAGWASYGQFQIVPFSIYWESHLDHRCFPMPKRYR